MQETTEQSTAYN